MIFLYVHHCDPFIQEHKTHNERDLEHLKNNRKNKRYSDRFPSFPATFLKCMGPLAFIKREVFNLKCALLRSTKLKKKKKYIYIYK